MSRHIQAEGPGNGFRRRAGMHTQCRRLEGSTQEPRDKIDLKSVLMDQKSRHALVERCHLDGTLGDTDMSVGNVKAVLRNVVQTLVSVYGSPAEAPHLYSSPTPFADSRVRTVPAD